MAAAGKPAHDKLIKYASEHCQDSKHFQTASRNTLTNFSDLFVTIHRLTRMLVIGDSGMYQILLESAHETEIEG